jgi:four helix bundle protein
MDEQTTGFASYRDLVVWRAAVELSVNCYEVTRDFPASEVYGMTAQIRRSSASIAANIAEGHGRESTSSFIQFLRIAQGSLKELETHLIISERVSLLKRPDMVKLTSRSDEIGKMLRSLIRNLQRREKVS